MTLIVATIRLIGALLAWAVIEVIGFGASVADYVTDRKRNPWPRGEAR